MTKSISATVIADSISEVGDRITTLELTFPRFLLAELNTHRAFSRNSASSRARSTKKTIQEVRDDPFVPVHWPSEKVGMAGGAPLHEAACDDAVALWEGAHHYAVAHAEGLVVQGVHKSIVNRVLEPFMWHTAVVTATEWNGFFSQRLALLDDGTPAAEPHFFDLAQAMKDAIDESFADKLGDGEWHLPYVTKPLMNQITNTREFGPSWLSAALKVSVARCAGVSYLNQDADRPLEKDITLYERLASAKPPHWSPFEHVATPVSSTGTLISARRYNLTGWASLRWYLEASGAKLDDEMIERNGG